jgi:hypothetical protein
MSARRYFTYHLPDAAALTLLDCWKDGTVWANNPPGDGKPGIDFAGLGVRDLILCDILVWQGRVPAERISALHAETAPVPRTRNDLMPVSGHLPDSRKGEGGARRWALNCDRSLV